jgi:ABC-type bacteriocin/lantibiotic exporter with double-glycine peptidase domain
MSKKTISIWIEFLSFIKPFWKYQLLLFTLLLVSNAAPLASPYILKLFIDQVLPNRDIELLWTLVLTLVGLYLLRILVSFACDYLFTWIGNRVMLNISLDLFDHIVRLPMQYFKDNSSSDLVYRIDKDVEQVQRALTTSLVGILNNGITVIGLAALMCFLSVKLFLSIALLYPLLWFSLKRLKPKITVVVEGLRKKQSDMLSFYSERFTNVKLIKAYRAYSHERMLLNEKLENLSQSYLAEVIVTSWSRNTGVLITAMMPVILIAFGGHDVVIGALTLGTLIAFLQYANKLHDPIKNILSLYVDIINTSVSLQRVFKILEVKVACTLPSNVVLDPLEKIEFRNVTVNLGGQEVLQSINAEFCIGKNYGISGTSGSGKSTLLDVLAKFSTPDGGSVHVNGHDLKFVSFDHWMKHITMQGQNFLPFNSTIVENIRYNHDRATSNDIQAVIELTGLNRRLASGIDTSVGDLGNKLSGGERQRLAIGRAMLRTSDILLIDEGTSEIDSMTEERLYRHLIQSRTFKSVFIVSHRLSAFRGLDEIIFLEDGQVVERGTLESLVAKRAKFFHAFKEQIELSKPQIEGTERYAAHLKTVS